MYLIRIAIALTLSVALFGADSNKPEPIKVTKPEPIKIASEDSQRLQQLVAEREMALTKLALAQAQLRDIQHEAQAIRFKSCAASLVIPEECGEFSTDGGIQRLPKKGEK